MSVVPEREEPISLDKVHKDLQRVGIGATGAEIDERDLQTARQAALTNVVMHLRSPWR
jgi:hypothetical protein